MTFSLKTVTILAVVLLFSKVFYSGQVYLEQINEQKLQYEPLNIYLTDRAYIITTDLLYSLNTNNPYNLELNEFKQLSGTKSIAFIGHFCYSLTQQNNIEVYDFSKQPPNKKTTLYSSGNIRKIVIDNGFLYTLNDDIGLQIYNVNIADFPVFLNSQIIPFNSNGLFISNQKAYITSETGTLSIIDVADKSKLSIIGTYSAGVKFYEPYIDGNLAYIPQGETGIQVLDISKLPTPEWKINLFGRRNTHQVIAANFYVWAADDKSIEIFYQNNPKQFYFAGNIKFSEKINKIALIEGKYIYIGCKDKKIRIVKIDYKY